MQPDAALPPRTLSPFTYLTAWTAALVGFILVSVDDPGTRFTLLSVVAACYGLWSALGTLSPKWHLYLRPLERGPGEYGNVALTFDDGPVAETMPGLLAALREERVRAAFFVLGEAAAARPDLIQRLEADGHLVGVRSHTLRRLQTLLWGLSLWAELDRAAGAVAAALDRRPRLVRTAFGNLRPGVASGLRRTRRIGIGWDVHAREWLHRHPENIAAQVAGAARNGSVIAFNERSLYALRREAGDAADTVRLTLARLRDRGFQCSRLDRLLDVPGYDQDGPGPGPEHGND